MSMTESEAKSRLSYLKSKAENALSNTSSNCEWAKEDVEGTIVALAMAISALEEIQQYRAIGTVSEFRELKEKATAIKADGFSDHLLNMGYTKGMKDGYAKAIDDFSKAVSKRAYHKDYNAWLKDTMISIFEGTIDEIAAELKGE